jgi:lysophospholipase L1-like esterase
MILPFRPHLVVRVQPLALLLVLAPGLLLPAALSAPAEETSWHNLAALPLEGKGWTATQHLYDRLPAKAEGVVRTEVWDLSHDSTGLRYRFVTDASALRGRWKLRREGHLALPHMPATGVSGLDLYVRDGDRWHWVGAGRPEKPGLNEALLASGLKQEKNEYLLYLPLYNGVESVEIGLPPGAVFEPAPDRYAGRKPILFYGTSITQGGCASRPGMAHASVLGRMLDWPIVNLGFSGNGKSEPEVAQLLSGLDPAAYVLDGLPNLSAEEAAERIEPFVKTIRAAHPKTAIILVENVTYADSPYRQERLAKVIAVNSLLKKLYEQMRASDDAAVYYVPTGNLLGSDGEDTVDGTHPTDLGFLRMAQGMAPVLREALRTAGAELSVPRQ